jgi:hypothetical protein
MLEIATEGIHPLHMWKSSAVALLLLTGISIPAFANLGDSESWEPSRDGIGGLVTRFYSTADRWIAVTFLEGRSECELIKKRNAVDFSNDEARVVLDIYLMGFKWSKTHEDSFGSKWALNVSAPVALASVYRDQIVIETVKYIRFTGKYTADHILAE